MRGAARPVAPGGATPRTAGRVRAAAAAGALLGAVVAAAVFAPASWLAGAVQRATDGRLLLADARGSLWNGSALPVLTGGAGSRDASVLPSRLAWRLVPEGLGLGLRLRQACCIGGELRLRVEPGIARTRIALLPPEGVPTGTPLAQWPAAWLAGLGTPFNTLQLGGTLALSAGPRGLAAEGAAGRWRLDGDATLAIDGLASRLVTLPMLGSYRLVLTGGDIASLSLTTTAGPLLMSGQGQLGATGLRFRGEARAAPGAETALANLLNLIGRRQGALSVLSIG